MPTWTSINPCFLPRIAYAQARLHLHTDADRRRHIGVRANACAHTCMHRYTHRGRERQGEGDGGRVAGLLALGEYGLEGCAQETHCARIPCIHPVFSCAVHPSLNSKQVMDIVHDGTGPSFFYVEQLPTSMRGLVNNRKRSELESKGCMGIEPCAHRSCCTLKLRFLCAG